MLEVHKNGKGIAGLYTKDIAETKVTIANQAAQQDGYPFRSEIEEDV
jgi:ATP-dependent Clp protease adaptor protein ClpS